MPTLPRNTVTLQSPKSKKLKLFSCGQVGDFARASRPRRLSSSACLQLGGVRPFELCSSWSLCVPCWCAEMNEGVALGDDVSEGEDGVCFVCLDTSPSPIQSGCACRGAAGLAHLCCRVQAAETDQHRDRLIVLSLALEECSQIVRVTQRVGMLGSQHPLRHCKHLALHLLRLIVLSLALEGYSQIVRRIQRVYTIGCEGAAASRPALQGFRRVRRRVGDQNLAYAIYLFGLGTLL